MIPLKEFTWKKNFCVLDRVIGYIVVIIVFFIVLLYYKSKNGIYINILVIFGILFFTGFEILLIRYEFIFHKGVNTIVISDKGLTSFDLVHLITEKNIIKNSQIVKINILDRLFIAKRDFKIIIDNDFRKIIIIADSDDNSIFIMLSRKVKNYMTFFDGLLNELGFSLVVRKKGFFVRGILISDPFFKR